MSASPIVKWAGGKSRLLAQYQPYLPREFKGYFEPFVGGGALFFWLRSQRGAFPARLNDSNEELINCYRVVQREPGELVGLLKQMQLQHNPDYYYQVRASEPKTDLERAARLLYLNKTCYNGLYRVNAAGRFNVPLGRYKNPAIVNEAGLWEAHRELQGAELTLQSFEEAAAEAKKGDFVYFDPPYHPLNPTSNFTSYTKDCFGEAEQFKLAQLFKKLSKRGCHVLLSNSDAPLIRGLYHGFCQIEILAPRFINSKSQKRAPIVELLILGRPPAD